MLKAALLIITIKSGYAGYAIQIDYKNLQDCNDAITGVIAQIEEKRSGFLKSITGFCIEK